LVVAAKYRKKPVVVEAVQWSGSNWHEMLAWAEWEDSADARSLARLSFLSTSGDLLRIRTLEGTMTASPGDWVIRGVVGEFYPCKPDIFEATYEEVA
jgi:hypothetical protein